MNAFDNGDTWATVIIFSHNQGLDIQPSETVSPTLRKGGGGMAIMKSNQEPIVFYGNRVDDIRVQGEVVNTLQARMGTGGGNMPLVAIQGNMIGRADTAGPQGKGYTEEGEPMFTLTKTDIHAVAGNSIVRRLTPKECERLQGFPDGWTADQADSHRYKQMGNAVAVPVVEWIVKRLVAAHKSPDSDESGTNEGE